MQRSNAFIALFVLLLSLSPCNDLVGDNSCSDGVHYHESKGSEQGTDESDNCLPFCSCTCCKTLVTTFVQTLDFFVDNRELHGGQQKTPICPPLFDIWQPPRS